MFKQLLQSSFIVIICISFSFARDGSRLKISLGAEKIKLPVHFVVTNPQGQREGQTSDNSVYINEQDNGTYDMEALPGIPLDEAEKSLQYDSDLVPAGIHTMTVYGIDTSTYSFSILSKDSNRGYNSPDPDGIVDILLAGKTARFKIDYDPRPGKKQTTFEKVVTFETLRQDLQAAKELKAIRSDEVFNRLMQIITDSEKQQRPERIKALETLQQEIKSQPKRTIHPQIYDIIQQDISTLLNTL